MSKKPDAVEERKSITLRVEGSVPVARLREMLGKEPALKLEIVAPRAAHKPGELGREATP
jgi:hypothetical protein